MRSNQGLEMQEAELGESLKQNTDEETNIHFFHQFDQEFQVRGSCFVCV